MENSFLTQIKKFIQPEFIDALSMNSSDSKEGIQRAFDVTIPSLLMKLHDTDSTLLQSILSKAQGVFNGSSDIHSKLSGVSSIVSSLFGSNYDGIKSNIAKYANISEATSDSVLKTSMVSIFDYFKDLSPDFDLSIIKNFIASKLPDVKGLIPASFAGFATSAFANDSHQTPTNPNINKVVNENETNQYKTNNSPYKEQKDEGGGGFLKVLIPLLIGVAAIFFLYRMCSKDKEPVTNDVVVTDTINNTTDTPVTTTVTRQSQIVKLHDGTELNAYKGGIEEQLVAFLDKGEYKTMSEEELKAIWFDFDYLNFDTASATITGDTKIQLDNIAAILKAYPDAKIKIGGYTDKVGNEVNNKKLSTDRANAVKTYLSDKGFASQIDGAEGYGSEFAKYAADAPEEDRVLDRRVSLSVRNK